MRKNILSIKKIGKLCATTVMCMSLLVGCGGNDEVETTTAKNVSLNEVHTAVKEAYGEEYIPSYTFDEEYIVDVFGLKSDMYDEIIAEGPKVSFNIDTFIAVKAKSGKGKDVEKVLSDYRDSQINDAMQYPVNAVKIQASKVIAYGDYVFFVCLGEIPQEIQEKGDEAILEEAKKDNKIAEDTIKKIFE